MRYEVKTVAAREEIESAPRFQVADYRWETGYTPEVTGAMVYVRGQGFLIRLTCAEADPKALYTEADSPVHLDSCLECFLNFAPEQSESYVNLEANANGTLHCKIGPGRRDRTPLRSLDVPLPTAEATREAARWSVTYFVPLKTVAALYGKETFAPGDRLQGNFYKCGDETPHPHYGMWSPVETPTPDFHRPEYFGELVIGE